MKSEHSLPASTARTGFFASHRVLLAALLLAVVSAAVFLPTLHSGFIPLDDPRYVRENPAVLSGISAEGIRTAFGLLNREYWVPVLQLSYMLDAEAFGMGPEGFHLTNILLHGVNGALLFLVLRAATGSFWPGLLAASLFALHPMRTESVAWITARKDLLSGLFFLLGLGAYIYYANPTVKGRGKWYTASVVALLLGLWSKPVLVFFPLLLFLVDFWPLGRLLPGHGTVPSWWTANRPLFREKIPFLVLSAVFSLLTLATQRPYIIHSAETRFEGIDSAMRSVISYFYYLGQTIWPISLGLRFEGTRNIFWTLLGLGALALVAHLAIMAALFLVRKRRPYLLVGWLWYLVALFPASGFVPVGAQWLSDRFTYIPHMGLFMALSWLAADLGRSSTWRKKAAVAAALAALLACAVMTEVQVGRWSDSVTVLKRAVQLSPEDPVAWRILGDALEESGKDPAQAIEALERSIELFPGYADAHNNLGAVLVSSGKRDEAVQQFQETLRLKPDHVDAHFNLGAVHLDAGRIPEAVDHFAQAILLDPGHTRALNGMGNALRMLGKLPDAEIHLREAVRLRPDMAEAHNGLGAVLLDSGRAGEAVLSFERALEQRTDYSEAQNNLGLALVNLGRLSDAIEAFQTAAEGDMGNAEVRNNLGSALRKAGRLVEAETQLKEALRLDPGSTQAHNNLGLVLHDLGDLAGAARHYVLALEKWPDDPKIHVNLADALAEAGKDAEAAAHYQKALSMGFDNDDLRNNLGVTLSRTGRYQEAVAQFERALEFSPDGIRIRLNLGNALLDAGRPGEAAVRFEEVLKLSPGNPVAAERLERANRKALSGK